MNTLSHWLYKHQVAGFLLLVFIISWTNWLLGYILFPDDELLQAMFFKVGIFAPALVSIFISGQINRNKAGVSSTLKKWGTFCMIWLAAWFHIVIYAHVTSNLPIDQKLVMVSAVISTLPAFIASSVFSRNEGVKKLLVSIVRLKGNPFWFLFALLIIPITMYLGYLLSIALGNELPSINQSFQEFSSLQPIAVIMLIFVNEFLQAGGLPEEVGWRGFVLPRMQTRFSPLIASILLGFFWALWHGPLLIGMFQDAGLWRMLLRILMIGISFTWIYNRTGGSLLAVMLLHASWNTTLVFLPRTDIFLVLMTLLLTAAVLGDKMWKKLPADSDVLLPSDS